MKNARSHGNLAKRTSELQERAINSKKHQTAICCWEEWRKGFSFCWRSKAIVEPSRRKKIKFWGVLDVRGAYFHAFKTSDQAGHTCVGPQKLRWPRAPRSLNPFLSMGVRLEI